MEETATRRGSLHFSLDSPALILVQTASKPQPCLSFESFVRVPPLFFLFIGSLLFSALAIILSFFSFSTCSTETRFPVQWLYTMAATH